MKKEESMLEYLKQYIATTPIEQIKAEWKEILKLHPIEKSEQKNLYLVTIKYGFEVFEFYVVAEHETEASEKAQEEYDSYKYYTAKVTKIELLAENKQYSYTKKVLVL